MKDTLKRSSWLNSLFFTLIQRFSLFIFAFAGFFMLTHHSLQKEQVGVYALFQTIVAMVEYVKMGLIRNALIKFFHDSRYSHKQRQIQSTSLLINVLFSLAAILFFLLAGDWISALLKAPALRELLQVSIGIIILQIPFNHCEIVFQANMQFKTTFYAYLLRQGILFFFIVSSLFSPPGELALIDLVIAQAWAIAIASIFFLFASGKYIRWRYSHDREVLYRLLSYGKFVFGTALVSHIYKFADHFVTAYTIGDAATGKIYVSYYNVVARISGVLDIPFMAAADVLFPKNAMVIETEGIEKVRYYFERMVGTLTALIIPASLFIAFIPGLIIRIVAGSAYLEAIPILRITMIFAFLRPFYSQFGYTMDSIGKPQVNFIVNIIFLFISVFSTYWGIRVFHNLEGAVYATTFTMIAGCVTFYFILRKILGIKISSILRYSILTYTDLFKIMRKYLPAAK